MALTIANEVRQAALNGIAALFNSGQFRLLATATELANLTFASTAFQGATNANPSTALSNAITADNTVTPGTINAFELRTSAGAVRISGTVSTIAAGTGDLQITDVVIPGTATSVTCTGGLTLSLNLS